MSKQRSLPRSALSVMAATMALALSACATPASTPPPSASEKADAAAAKSSDGADASAEGSASPAGAAKPSAGGRPPGTPPPFAEVTKGAEATSGFITVWRKEDKTWLEIAPEQFDRPFFLGSSLASGLGERFFLPGLMGREHVVTLRRSGSNVQLVARNLRVRAPAGTPLARAVAESYSDSLVASAPVASAAHPERKSILVDAGVLLGGDIPGAQTALETAFRLPYALDRANTAVERVRVTEQGTYITVRAHYAVAKMPALPRAAPGAPPPNPATLPDPPKTVPDPRSLFLAFAYTLSPLPAEPMRPRIADQRVGHFTDAYIDLADDSGGDRKTHLVNRWRLEKKDPQAELSEPNEPIRAVMDRNIPEKWRDAVRAGILEWNKAFERAGFRDAIRVEQQPADADWTSLEGTRILAVRWFAMEGPGAVAVGPSQTDPRTGEILRAASIIPENWVRIGRTQVAESLPRLPGEASHDHAAEGRLCTYASDALEHAEFGFALLAERGAIDPEGPDADRFIAESLKDVVMHEVGHALGLRHNFKGSTGITLAQLRDASFVRARGVSNSVMDYNPLNLPLAGEPTSQYQQTTIGAYDAWAIEYAYREFAPEAEHDGLAKIAARSASDPNLVYATDEDAGGGSASGLDPLANRFDLGDDVLAYAGRQFKLARELWQRTQQREVSADDDYAVYRRNLQRGLRTFGFTAPLLAKHVGGVYTSRELAGAGRPLLTPVPAATQREALVLLEREIFSTASFRFSPAFMSRLGVDQLDRVTDGRFVTDTDFSLATAVLGIQRTALDQLMSEGVASRLADAETKVGDRGELLTYAELQSRLADAIWSELRTGADIGSLRRNLQREHVRRLASGLVKPTPSVAADVRAVHRQVAVRLESQLKRALAAGKFSSVARAHMAESLQNLSEALRAPLVKQGA